MKVSWKNTNHYIDSHVGFFVSEKKEEEKKRELIFVLNNHFILTKVS